MFANPQEVIAAVGKAAVMVHGDPVRRAGTKCSEALHLRRPPFDNRRRQEFASAPSPQLAVGFTPVLLEYFTRCGAGFVLQHGCSEADRNADTVVHFICLFQVSRINAGAQAVGEEDKGLPLLRSFRSPAGDLRTISKQQAVESTKVFHPATQSGTSGRPVSSVLSRWNA